MIINPLIERGRQQGRQEGLQQGRQTREKEIALSMLKKGFSPPVVAEVTGLQLLEIEALKTTEK